MVPSIATTATRKIVMNLKERTSGIGSLRLLLFSFAFFWSSVTLSFGAMATGGLANLARSVLASRADLSEVEFALAFLPQAGVDAKVVGNAGNDCLVKAARMILSLIKSDADTVDEGCLQRLVKDFALVATPGAIGHVPRVAFGETGIQMPIVTLGCMRFQQAWGPKIQSMNQVGADCQDNLVAILRKAILDYGMVHIETARAYGCSELQIGVALQQLILTGEIKREDLIIQTKVNASQDPDVFRQELETSMKLLKVDYIDLFAVHGFNLPEHYDWCFGQDGNNCMKVVQEFVRAGKIRHVGFSTHGPTDLIVKAINTNAFEYVNIHYHAIGSYTASGYGNTQSGGNLEVLELLQQKGMGIFIISPYDKGGALYMPSTKLRKICAPEAEPIIFHSWWLWNHDQLWENAPKIHTFTVGAARPSDLDEPALAAFYQRAQPKETVQRVQRVWGRIKDALVATLGESWAKSWWKGLPKAINSRHQIEHNQIVWLYNCVQAYGLYNFAKTRYESFEGNAKTWDYSKSAEENHIKRGTRGWGYVPGLPLDPTQDYTADDLKQVPAENLPTVLRAAAFCLESLASPKQKQSDDIDNKIAKLDVPAGWQTAYDLRTSTEFPLRA